MRIHGMATAEAEAAAANVLAGIRADADDLTDAEMLCRRAVAVSDAFPDGVDELLERLRVQERARLRVDRST